MTKSKYLFFSVLFCFSSTIYSQINCDEEVLYTGEGTYYFIDQFGDFGNCSIENEVFVPFLIGALNAPQYGQADYCGACAEVSGPNGMVQIHIIDQCPECAHGDIDLSPAAFDRIADRIDGRIPISWKIVPCSVSSGVKIYFKEGSSQYWAAVQIRNHKNPLAKLEFWNGNQFVNLQRQDYNYFLKESGMGPGPFEFRVTDVYGNQIIESDVPLVLTTELIGVNQFPDCNPVGVEIDKLVVPNFTPIDGGIVFLRTDFNYSFFDLNGKLVKGGEANYNEVNLRSGVYLLKITDDKSYKTEKIYIP